jgi:hypothetical protein
MRPIAGRMTTAATKLSEISRRSPGWRLVTWMLLLAFTWQAFATQTHIHAAQQIRSGHALASAPERSKSPLKSDAADCPLCQAVFHAGAFVSPAAPFLYLPAFLAEWKLPAAVIVGVSVSGAYDWKSRGPPQR